jgi:hypothetical protein
MSWPQRQRHGLRSFRIFALFFLFWINQVIIFRAAHKRDDNRGCFCPRSPGFCPGCAEGRRISHLDVSEIHRIPGADHVEIWCFPNSTSRCRGLQPICVRKQSPCHHHQLVGIDRKLNPWFRLTWILLVLDLDFTVVQMLMAWMSHRYAQTHPVKSGVALNVNYVDMTLTMYRDL